MPFRYLIEVSVIAPLQRALIDMSYERNAKKNCITQNIRMSKLGSLQTGFSAKVFPLPGISLKMRRKVFC
jgi:hypothetical protein